MSPRVPVLVSTPEVSKVVSTGLGSGVLEGQRRLTEGATSHEVTPAVAVSGGPGRDLTREGPWGRTRWTGCSGDQCVQTDSSVVREEPERYEW